MLTKLAAAVDAAPGPLERLAALRDLEDAVAAAETRAVADARARNESWSRVGAALRRSKQATQRKYQHRAPGVGGVEPTAVERPVREPRRPAGWDVQTPRGRTLLRVVKRRG